MKAPTPKFDLLATNFPPLPGSSSRMPDELVLENRMSDVVKGVYKEKVNTEVSHLLFHCLGLYLYLSGLLYKFALAFNYLFYNFSY